MLQFLKTKNFDEVVSDIKISKVVFTCIMLIMAIFAGISCQINQTEQNAAYVKKYLASKKGYYSNLVSNMRRAATEKYYGISSKAEDFSESFKNSFQSILSQNPRHNLKEGVVFMQLKYLNDYFSEILDQTISQETTESQLNRFLDLRFAAESDLEAKSRTDSSSNPNSGSSYNSSSNLDSNPETQAAFASSKTQILNTAAAKIDQLMIAERLTIDPAILEAFLTPLVDVYYNQLITISFSKASGRQNNPVVRFLIINLPILILLVMLIFGYFFYTSIGGRLAIFCLVLSLFFIAFNLQAPASNRNIDLTYNQLSLFAD
ncbi:hypothetical protein HG449_002890 [Candidatus Saccharibacteria bacterium]|jgi:hypothetical protein|nr:hypothetical protein [Candidatus Saccharibacteria bacterium]